MTRKEAKREACKRVAARIRGGLSAGDGWTCRMEDGITYLPDAEDRRLAEALRELAGELERRAASRISGR